MANQTATAEEILERIRQRAQERRGQGPSAALSSSVPHAPQAGAFELSQLRHEVLTCNELHAAVGTVNPRRGGPINAVAQFAKKVMRRSLTWYTRPLHLFQGAVARALNHVVAEQEGLHTWVASLNNSQQQLSLEVYSRLGKIEHDFKKLQDDRILDRIKSNERNARRILHAMQLSATSQNGGPPPTTEDGEFDYFMFEERFRGEEADIKERQKLYLGYFNGRENVVDLGCGRGEFLELLKDSRVTARGVESGLDAYLICKEKGLDVSQDNLFTFLSKIPDGSLGGIFSAQVIEHLPVPLQIKLVELAYQKLRPGSPLILETINPECVLALVRNYYLDPSHVRPVHPELLKFILESKGFGKTELRYSAPATDRQLPPLRLDHNTPELQRFNDALHGVNNLLFGYQDYAAIAWR